MVQRVTAGQARNNFAYLINTVAFGGKRIEILRHGKRIVAIVSIGTRTGNGAECQRPSRRRRAR